MILKYYNPELNFDSQFENFFLKGSLHLIHETICIFPHRREMVKAKQRREKNDEQDLMENIMKPGDRMNNEPKFNLRICIVEVIIIGELLMLQNSSFK